MSDHQAKIEALKAMMAEGRFHHATHRHGGPSFNHGLYIYEKEDNGFNGYRYAFSFYDGTRYAHNADPVAKAEEQEAYEIVRHTGVCSNSYAHGG